MSEPDEVPPFPAEADHIDAPVVAEGTDVTADPRHLETDEPPPTSDAEAYREDGDTMGGTGGLDAGGAG